MQPPHRHTQVNLAELRAQIFKKLGPERSKQYFAYLSRLLSLKITKVQFNQLCVKVLGRENVSMHNQFIHSILKNACHGKTPSSRPTSDKKMLDCNNEGHHVSLPYPLSSGNALSLSPQKPRSEIGMWPIGKVDFPSHNSMITSNNVQKSMQHRQVFSGKTDYEGRDLLHHPDSLPLVKGSTDGVVSGNSRHHNKELLAKQGKEVSSRSVLEAPLGIPFCSASIGGARKTLPSARNDRFVNSIDKGGLLDTRTLGERMQQVAIAQGLEGVSKDCANLLNNGLDSYLKRLIRSCIDLVGAKSRSDMMDNTNKHHRGAVNGVLPGRHCQAQSSGRTSEGVEVDRPTYPVSLLDFKVAMELNPHQLGEDWPLLLERMYTHSFEE